MPIVIYLRGGKPNVSREKVLLTTFGTPLLVFRYFAFGLSPSRAAEYLRRPEPLAWALAALMGRGELSRMEHRLACLEPIARAELDDARRLLLANCVATYVQLNDVERESYETLLDHDENREVAVMERTLLTTWDRASIEGYEQGLEQGLARGLTEGERKGKREGEREGRREGKRELLLDLLGRRFGSLPQATVERVQALTSPDELSRLAERVLDARSLDDLGL